MLILLFVLLKQILFNKLTQKAKLTLIPCKYSSPLIQCTTQRAWTSFRTNITFFHQYYAECFATVIYDDAFSIYCCMSLFTCFPIFPSYSTASACNSSRHVLVLSLENIRWWSPENNCPYIIAINPHSQLLW